MNASRRDPGRAGRALRGQDRLGPPHARAPRRLCRAPPSARPQGDHRRRRRRRPSARHDRLHDAAAGAGRAGRKRKALKGQDSLLSIVQMPAGIPVGTLAIGEAGAINAGLLAAQILALATKTSPPALAACARGRPRASPRRPKTSLSTHPRLCRPGRPSASWAAASSAACWRWPPRGSASSATSTATCTAPPATSATSHDHRAPTTTRPRSRASPPPSTSSPTSSRTCRVDGRRSLLAALRAGAARRRRRSPSPRTGCAKRLPQRARHPGRAVRGRRQRRRLAAALAACRRAGHPEDAPRATTARARRASRPGATRRSLGDARRRAVHPRRPGRLRAARSR